MTNTALLTIALSLSSLFALGCAQEEELSCDQAALVAEDCSKYDDPELCSDDSEAMQLLAAGICGKEHSDNFSLPGFNQPCAGTCSSGLTCSYREDMGSSICLGSDGQACTLNSQCASSCISGYCAYDPAENGPADY